MRILVVDSDRDIREMVEDLLFEQDFEIRGLGDADEAVEALQESGFDVLLCRLSTLRSPGGRLRRLARELSPQMRVVAMSANRRLATRREADANLSKPFSRAELLAALGSR